MVHTRVKKAIIVGVILAIIIAWMVYLYNTDPVELIESIGVEQGYALAFLVAIFGGWSTFTAASYFTLIVTLGAGGLNPILLGIFGGTGITIGDSLFYLLGLQSRDVTTPKFQKKVDKLHKFLENKKDGFVQLITFFFGATPLPNDALAAALGLLGYTYWKMALPLWVGNIILSSVIAFGAAYGFSLL